MSIYPVRLSEWFPFGDEHYESTFIMVKVTRCLACGKKPRYSKAVAHHSIGFGHGDVWCDWKCCKSGKIARSDKRRERRMNRKYGSFGSSQLVTDLLSIDK